MKKNCIKRIREKHAKIFKVVESVKIVMSMKTRAIYEKGTLKLLEEIDLEEGEEVEIELKKKKEEKKDILKYAGMLKDLNEKEEKLFLDVVKRRNLFEETLKL